GVDAVMRPEARVLADDHHALEHERDVLEAGRADRRTGGLGTADRPTACRPVPLLAHHRRRPGRVIAPPQRRGPPAEDPGQLEHPHIVPIYKVGGYKNEVLYIVMRCVDGPSVRQLLERDQRLSVVDAARIARQVADALAYAHGHGIVHRDVKPDNVLLDGSGHALVTDFGIAKAAQEASASQLTTEGMAVGT